MAKNAGSTISGVDGALFVGVVALAMAIRVAYLSQVRTVPLFDLLVVDGRQYNAWAGQILSGQWLGERVGNITPLLGRPPRRRRRTMSPRRDGARSLGSLPRVPFGLATTRLAHGDLPPKSRPSPPFHHPIASRPLPAKAAQQS